jgi:hypothetical protein
MAQNHAPQAPYADGSPSRVITHTPFHKLEREKVHGTTRADGLTQN